MKRFLQIIILLLFSSLLIQAATTKIVVRAKAHDAKFIGSSMSGALVTIKNSDTGEILASGPTVGSTGNTQKIMKEAHRRGESFAEGSAKFEAILDIDHPILATIEVRAPLGQRQSMTVASKQVWLIPGKDIAGDGIIFDIPGFVVDVLTPRAHQMVKMKDGRYNLEISANVVMMCGCPTSSGGLWDADKFEVVALIRGKEKTVELPLTVSRTSLFSASYTAEQPGLYRVTVYAYDAATGNTGVDQSSIIISE